MNKQAKTNKIAIILGVFISLMGITWGRLVYLQIIQQERLTLLSTFNFMRLIKINPPRGNILDTHDELLATNKPVFAVCWHGSGKKNLTEQHHMLIQELAQLLSLSITDTFINELQQTERLQRSLVLAKKISFEQLSYLVEHFCDSVNIMIQTDMQRYYPRQNIASHIIGYLSTQNVDVVGKMGLEKIYEQELKGTPGIKKQTVNATGKALEEQEFQAYIMGKNIRTTIDIELQEYAEKAFPAQDIGCMIIMDPYTGALRALLSRPSFNPDMFLRHISQQEWDSLQETHFFINRACQACYPPASLFKLVTMAAALEHAIISPDAIRMCPGYYLFHDRPYHCNLKTGHGLVNLKEALAQSCNVIFFEIGKKIAIDTLAQYAHRFGLGEPTGIILPEKTGLVPTSSWKRLIKGEHWRQGETLSAAIGQSFLLVTPIQIARMFGSIASGYLVRPRILEDETIEKLPLTIQESTRAFLKKCMKAAIKHGTGKRVRDIPHITIYGKTGTAQVSSLDTIDTDQEHRSHAWFAANFAYKDQAPLTMVIMVEHAGGSRKPTCIAKEFLKLYQRHITQKTTQGELLNK